MKYIVYKGNPRNEETATKYKQFEKLELALDTAQFLRNNNEDAYVLEVPEPGDYPRAVPHM